MTIFLTANDLDILVKASKYLKKQGFLNTVPSFDPLNEPDYLKEAAKKEGRSIWYGFIGIFAETFQFANNTSVAEIIILLTENTFEKSMQFAVEQSKK